MLGSLNEDGRKSLIELAKFVQEGGSLGDLKRGHKLLREVAELREDFEKRKAEFAAKQNEAAPAAMAAPQVLPQNVAAMTSLQQLEAAEAETQTAYDWCDDNPQGGEFQGKEYSADQVTRAKQALRTELRAIPLRRKQIEQQHATVAAQRQSRQMLEQRLPQYFTPDNPMWKKATELIRSESVLSNHPNRDYIALALIRGDAELTKEAASAARPANGLSPAKPAMAAAPAARTGKAPLGKPHTANGSAPARSNGSISIAAAREALNKDGSRDSFANFLNAAGR